MSTIKELIRIEGTGGISFGDYELEQKTKLSDFKYNEDSYKVKTFQDITKLEKNGFFVYESVPGTAVLDFQMTDGGAEFWVEGIDNTQITIGMEPDCEYRVILGKETVGFIKTNLGGKLSFSADLTKEKAVKAKLVKM